MEFIKSDAAHLSTELQDKLGKYRYEVFIEKLGWQLDVPEGIERDEFDTPETLYVISQNTEENIVGCARLLPTTSPYLLEKIFPELLNGVEPPKSQDIWELSRFTAIDLSNTGKTTTQLSSEATLALLDKVVEYAKSQGATRLISVSPIGVERLLRNTKYRFHRAGPPMVINGFPLLACWIDI